MPFEKIVEKIVHVPKPYPVIKHIPVEVKVPVTIEKPVPYTIEKKVPYPIIIPVKRPQYHHHHHPHNYHSNQEHQHPQHYDHHTEFTHNKYQQVSAHRPQSSEQSSSSSASSSSGEYSPEYSPRPENLRESQVSSQQEQQTKLFSPSQSETPYNQQHQLHHQQQYAQLRRDLLTRERMHSSTEESEADSTEFRPMMSSQSAEYMSPSNNVETVVPPPPPNQQTRSSFHINVPSEKEPVKETHTSNSDQTSNQYTHNIEIPVHFYRLQPLENGEGFAITS